ncbi:MAG: UDP-N-acetylglucosamine 1-carboxyvinyltransferase [Candidatus Liptonbacteria bacterium]|nr:UDP-N-acetylglucosamine 1-carboxyvinyltransferase [Candidatus Liptonbacteria bacterium]
MTKFIVKGGKELHGEIRLAGAKAEAPKLMIASLLTDEPVRLDNFPKIGDTDITRELCERIGSKFSVKNGSATLTTPSLKNSRVLELSRRNRIPILALGPLLARTGEAEVPILGGDKIGPRPVDLHLQALRALGAEIEITASSFRAKAPKGLRGALIELGFPSVGATENTILAAVLAKGKTVLKNAALGPEIIGLIKMLQKMGAIIELAPPRTITIEGVSRLRGTRHRILPDRNEAVSFACLAIATGGDILIRGAVQEHLITFLNTLRRIGADYEVLPEGIRFRRMNNLRVTDIETATHPGFMTDWQQPFAVLLTQADGASTIHETIYEDRFGYVADLNAMGASIEISDMCPSGRSCRFSGGHSKHVAKISGPSKLRGGKLAVRDLRSGMVDVIAALVAEGESLIEGVEEIDRGYERIDERLRKLGAEIKRI